MAAKGIRHVALVVSLSIYSFDCVVERTRAFAMMGLARGPMARVPDIGFWKLCGSGIGEGFTPLPNLGVYAVLATWPDEETAKARIASSTQNVPTRLAST